MSDFDASESSVTCLGLRVGSGRSDITPGPKLPLLGYDQRAEFFPQGGNLGPHDRLRATVLIVDNGTTRLVLVTLDLAIVENPAAERLRAAAAAVAATSPDHVVVACSHTHSGPYPWSDEWAAQPVEVMPDDLGFQGPGAKRYASRLEHAVARATRLALADLAPSRFRARHACVSLGYRRRVSLPQGGVGLAWDLREWSGPAPEPAPDPAFVGLVAERGPRAPILLWNAAAHPVVLGKRSNVVSADWPGETRRRLERAHRGLRTLFLHGAGADTHPWLATGDNTADLETVAAPATALADLFLRTPGGQQDVRSPLAVRVIHVATSLGPIRIAAWRLGPARLLAFPGELFGATGRALRVACPAPLLIASTADGWSGYWPPASEFALGGYEVEAAPRKLTGDAEAVTEAAIALLASV
jgi:hypothetical protein